MEEIRRVIVDLILMLFVLWIVFAPVVVWWLTTRKLNAQIGEIEQRIISREARAKQEVSLAAALLQTIQKLENEYKLVDKKPEILFNESITETVWQPEPSQNEQELTELKQLRDQIKNGNYETYADHPDLSALGPLDAWRRTVELIEEKERNQTEMPTYERLIKQKEG